MGKNGFGVLCGLMINLVCPGVMGIQAFLLHSIVQKDNLSATDPENNSFTWRFWLKIESVLFSIEYQPVIVTNILGFENDTAERKKDKKVEWQSSVLAINIISVMNLTRLNFVNSQTTLFSIVAGRSGKL